MLTLSPWIKPLLSLGGANLSSLPNPRHDKFIELFGHYCKPLLTKDQGRKALTINGGGLVNTKVFFTEQRDHF